MVANWVKVVWILIGGTVAAAGAAYVGGVFEVAPNTPTESAVQQPVPGKADAVTETPASEEASAEQPATGEKMAEEDERMASLPPADEATDEAAPADEAAAEPEIIVPTFDLVRVEPDGSMVIAGSASPNSMVEVIAGATVIGTDKTGPSGDFAVVLDDPLKPGDYTIVLRSTTEDNVVATSTQTAIVAVPENESGQVLALVEEPGAPSRLITVPSAPEPKDEVEMAAKGDRPAAAGTGGDETVAATEEAASGGQPKPEMQAGSEEAVAETEMAAKETELVGDVADADAEAAAREEQVAAAGEPESGATELAEAKQPAAPPRVAVEAIEIEGRDIFVAGYAEAGATVRVYANNILLGQAVSSEAGRFLIEAEKDLPVGDYIVRADMLSADNADVAARAAVPFEREPGEKVAAIAAPQTVEPATADTEEGGDQMTADKAPAKEPMAAQESTAEQEAQAKDTDTGPQADGAGTTEVASLDNGTATDAEASNGAADGAAMQEATAPKLQNVSGAVIIRRGDTLWRLSRRVYGRGVRYTTIYLANQDQIADPDMIWPGQVFSVPGETEEGEEADLSAVAEQIADPDEVSEDVASSQD